MPTGKAPEFAIAYNVLADTANDNYEVFTMGLDGSGKRNITNQPGVEWTYHAYGERVFFISDRDTCQRCAYYLYASDYLGNDPVKLSEIPLADSWMSTRSDGREIIVRPSSKVDSAFYIIDLQEGGHKRLETGLPYNSDPLFINGGKQVVFRGGQTRSKRVEGFDGALYVIDTDGTNLRRLTYYPEGDTTAGKYGYRAGPPRLHPTEGFISYQSARAGKYSLYGVTPDGSRHWKLTDLPQAEGWHDWSPDGKWLAIELFDPEQTQFHIGLMDWVTREMTILTDSSFRYQQAPTFVLKSGNPPE